MKRALAASIALVACSPSAPPAGELAGAVAVVGESRLEPEALARILASRPSVSPRELVAAWVRTSLLARAALDRGVPHEGRSPALVRRLVLDWTARAATPRSATPGDIALARHDDWQRFDRPPSLIVHHAVFMKSRAPRPTFAADAMQIGTSFASQVHSSWDFAQFSAAAKALPLPPGIEVRAEQLPAFVADGRATESPAGFDPTFAQQAFTLQNPGDFTAAFDTPFGVHVIQLEKRLPAERPTDAEVGAALEPELVGRRVRRLQGEALSRLQPLLPVTIAPSAEEDMATWTGRVLAPTEGPASSPP